jgi:uncharacterized protein YkwD
MAAGCDESVDENAAERVIADDEFEDAFAVDRANPDEYEIEERAGGSCVNACGGQSSGGCWCDSACAQYGDCCADKVAVCDGAPPPPPPPPPVEGEVPSNAYCSAVASWPASSSSFETQVVTLVNQRRAAGATCGQYGAFPPAGPLTMNPALRCAGRKHDKDMITNNFFSHTGTGGTTPWNRIASAGYGSYVTAGENIAAGQSTPAAVVTGWMNSPGHCKNIMTAGFKEIGVGYAPGGSYGHYWTQTFAAKN